MMKILFLDADGVVNCQSTFVSATDGWAVDPYMALLVDRIKEATGCKVVLSSSWRNALLGRQMFKEKVTDFIDWTPGATQYNNRGEEIQAWLDKHPEVDRYAIIDDDPHMLDSQSPNFFKTSFLTGLTDEITKKVIEHLNA